MRKLSLVTFLFIAVIGCDGVTSVRGRVLDPKGKPVAGAAVALIKLPRGGRSSTATTDAEGKFSVSMVHAPQKVRLSLEVTRQEFQSYAEEIEGLNNYERQITLKPAEK